MLIGNLLVNYGLSGLGNPSNSLYSWDFQTSFKAGTVPLVFVQCAGNDGVPDVYHASLTTGTGTGTGRYRLSQEGGALIPGTGTSMLTAPLVALLACTEKPSFL